MNRASLFASAALILLMSGCGGGGAPTSASRQAVSPTIAVAQIPASALFGASAVDFARCLQGAADAACLSGARVALHAVAGAAATVPGLPLNLVTTSSGSSVTLTWSAPASGDAVTSYAIEAGSAPGLANLANFVTGSTATSFSAGGVGNGTYYVRVRAQNAAGASTASNESTLVVGSNGCTTAPNAPAGFAVSVSGSTVTLTWSAPVAGCAPSSYLLQAGSSAGGSELANSNVGGATTFVATGVGAGTYFVRVRAVNAYGTSGSSNEAVATVSGGAPTRWIGLSPNGMVDRFNPTHQCPLEYDLQLDLSVSGPTVSGTAITYLRRVAFSSCADVFGELAHWSVNGTVADGAISFAFGSTGAMRFSGTVSGGSMTGTFVITQTGQTGTFAVSRQ